MATSSILRGLNNTKNPLLGLATFTGQYEFTGGLLTVLVSCLADTITEVIYKQSNDGVNMLKSESFILTPNVIKSLQLNLVYPYSQIIVKNLSVTAQTALNIHTIYGNLLPTNANVNATQIGTADVNIISSIPIITTENVSQVGSKGNLQNATFIPLAQTNIFNCSGYAESTLTYQDTSPLNTGDMLIFVRVNNIADSEVCIGKLIPIVNANGTNRYASITLNLKAFNFIYVQNNSTTNTNTNSIISLFSY